MKAFTAGLAYASFADDRLGMLKVGHRADVTVVDRDLFQIPPDDLLKIKVRMTIVDGKPVYESAGP